MSARAAGFRQPAEWSPQESVWTAWPHIQEWGENIGPAKAELEAMIRALAAHEAVHVVVNSGPDAEEVGARFRGLNVRTHEMRFGDIWMRDIGPVFLVDVENALGAACFNFNGWGGKYIFEGDAEVGGHVAALTGAAPFRTPFILEGGALEVDGEGTCLTTRQCALNTNRNRHVTEAAVEQVLGEMLGAEKTLWIDRGLANDHTDGHIDTLVRFVAPGVVLAMEPGASDPNREVLLEILAALRNMRDAKNRRLEVVTVPSPGAVLGEDGAPMPASYANFLIANGIVIVPTYGSAADDAAVARIGEIFRGREVLGLSSKAILTGGGAFHCITQQQPRSSTVEPRIRRPRGGAGANATGEPRP
jgi:agmatine deiminase